MSLNIKRTTNLVGESVIDGESVVRYNASINSNNPEQLNYSMMVIDKTRYGENMDLCHEDQNEFEIEMYSLQKEAIEKEAIVLETGENDDENE